MRFSILIPCYNTAPYLEDCIKSVISQNCKDWEMILVNDGSTDNTEDIMNVYSEKDDRIRVFCQENQGVSASRNKAVREARGDYLLFLDSDDRYKDGKCLDQIEENINNEDIDIIVFGYQGIRSNGDAFDQERLKYLNEMKEQIYTGEKYLQAVLSEKEIYPWFLWLYAFRREFWKINNVKFDQTLCVAEDKDILYQVILGAKKIKILYSPIYQYRIRKGSATQLKSKKALKDELNTSKNNINKVNDMNINGELKKLLNSNFSYGYFGILAVTYYLGKNDRKEIFALLKENQKIMNYKIEKKYMFIRMMTHIVGFRITAKLLFIRYKWLVEKRYSSIIR